jgi:hypothetical protein
MTWWWNGIVLQLGDLCRCIPTVLVPVLYPVVCIHPRTAVFSSTRSLLPLREQKRKEHSLSKRKRKEEKIS